MTALKSGDPFGEKSGIPLAEVPQSIQVLDADDLRARSARTIGDALRSVPSASPGSPRGVPFQNAVVTVRGFAVDQMRNGVRQRNYEAVDPGSLVNVERIEVLKGPSAVLYGQSAVGGIVSIITKRPQNRLSAEASATFGSFDQAMGSLDLTGPVVPGGALSFRLTAEIERSDTYADFVPLNRDNFGLSLATEPLPGVSGHFVFEWTARRTVGFSGQPPIGTVLPNGIARLPRSRFLSEPDFAFLDLEAPLVQSWFDIALGGGWTLTPRISWNGYDQALARTGLRSLLPDLRTATRFGFAATSKGSFLVGQLDFSGQVSTRGIGHDLLFGVEWADERVKIAQDRAPVVPPIDVLAPVYGRAAGPPWPTVLRLESDLRSIAFYAQDLVQVNERLKLVLGLRYSRFDTRTELNFLPDKARFQSLVWQAGATVKLGPSLSLFGGVNTGFNADPVVGLRSAAGTPFDPERSRQAEIGIRHTSRTLNGAIAVFRLTRDNVVTSDPNNTSFNLQTGRQRTQGVELEANWRPAAGWSVQGGYAFIASRIVSSNNGDEGDSIADVPRHRANLFAEWMPQAVPGIALRAGVSFAGERRFSNARVSLAPGVRASDVRLPAYTIAQFGAAWRYRQFEIDVSITNAFDARYYVAGGEAFLVYPGEPRFVSVRIGSRF